MFRYMWKFIWEFNISVVLLAPFLTLTLTQRPMLPYLDDAHSVEESSASTLTSIDGVAPCVDKFPADVCMMWRVYGSCEYSHYTRVACQYSCEVCPGNVMSNADQNSNYVLCRDLEEYDCEGLAKDGYCSANFMVRSVHCRKTCNNCLLKPEFNYGDDANLPMKSVTPPLTTIDVTGCDDFDKESCEYWAEIGYCSQNRKVWEFCKISCGRCP